MAVHCWLKSTLLSSEAIVLLFLFSFCPSVHHWQHIWIQGCQKQSRECCPSCRTHSSNHYSRSSSKSFFFFFYLRNSPGCDSSLVISWTVHCVDPGGTAQHVHRPRCWKACGCPLPCISHHVIQSWRKNWHYVLMFTTQKCEKKNQMFPKAQNTNVKF